MEPPLHGTAVSRPLGRLVGFAGHVALMVPFAAAFVDPDSFAGFLWADAFAIIMFEFLGLHSIPFLHAAQHKPGRRAWLVTAGLILFYSLFALPFAFIAGRPWVALLFAAGLLANVAPALTRRTRGELLDSEWGFGIVSFILLAILHIFLRWPHIANDALLESQPNASGLWIDHPETLAWLGLLYFAGRAAYNVLEPWIAPHLPVRVVKPEAP